MFQSLRRTNKQEVEVAAVIQVRVLVLSLQKATPLHPLALHPLPFLEVDLARVQIPRHLYLLVLLVLSPLQCQFAILLRLGRLPIRLLRSIRPSPLQSNQ